MVDQIPMTDNSMPGNFINPAYSTPEQVKQLRDYADQLQKGSIAPTSTSWTGVLAQALMGLSGANKANQATGLQQQGIQSAAIQDPVARQLQAANVLPSNGIYGQQQPQVQPQPAAQNSLPGAILQQESGNNPNAPTSVNGAVGPGQIMPATFKQYAKPGENINNPQDNAAVSQRIVNDLSAKTGGDPARVAVGYFSGPGNIAPPGSPTPWKADVADGNGKHVSSYVQDISNRLMGNQPQQMAQNGQISPYSAYQHNPWANPQEQALSRGIITPTATPDVYGRPGVTSVAGGSAALPVKPGFQPGVMVPSAVSGGGMSATTQTPLLPPGQNAQQPGMQGQLQPLMDTAKNFSQQGAAAKAAADETTNLANAAYQSVPIRQTLATMKDDIRSHGDKMVWGPTADWLNNLKRGIAQHAPGLMSQADLDGLASADSFGKLTAQLQTMVGRQIGGTDASLMQGMQSVPGSHNSKEGALALIDMLDQVAKQNSQFMQQNQYKIGQPGFDLLAAKNKFYEDNPITNPITKHPLRMDLTSRGNTSSSAPSAAGEWGIKR